MYSRLFYLSFIAVIILFSSCKKEDNSFLISERDKYIGTFSGTTTTSLTSNGEFIVLDQKQTIIKLEKGADDSSIIIGKGTEYEINAFMEGSVFLIRGQMKHFTVKERNLDFNFSMDGMGHYSALNELTISYNGIETIGNNSFRLSVSSTLNRVP